MQAVKDKRILNLIGHILPARIHAWFSKRSEWMFAAMWIKDEQRHVWMWVKRGPYYASQQSLSTRTGVYSGPGIPQTR